MTAIVLSMLPTLITALLPVVTGLFAWIAASIAKKNATASALVRLEVIGAALLQKAWSHLGPEIQQGMADGKWDPEDTALIEKSVSEIIGEVADANTLKQIASALGLPLAGIISRLTSWLISKWTAAHDPVVTTMSASQFPVASPPIPVEVGSGAPDPTAG